MTLSVIDRYLAEQADLTAVERFARAHEAGTWSVPDRHYRDLVPLTHPGPGQQYGFAVDLDACTGCKACVTACHSLNGLDPDESWRTVGLLHGGPAAAPFQQSVTTACHHCVDPACLNGCPVDAYEKDPVTGIVAHLDDQCIGCGYCTITCPYEVPRFNAERGIVRKCDLCRDRLAAGEAPACVQACPNGAITIALVDTVTAVEAAAGTTLVPGAPPSSITVPTTIYRTRRELAVEARAADHFPLRPAPAHTPLVVMLVLTQLSVGAFLTDLVVRAVAAAGVSAAIGRSNAAVALASGVLAMAASIFHLGRPRYAFRAVVGVRHSWLSREIVTFGAFAGLATLYAAWPHPVLAGMVGLAGAAGVACSVMVYAVTHRVWWRARSTAFRFTMTSAVCGLATVLLTALAISEPATARVVRPLALVLAGASAIKLAWEAMVLRHLRAGLGAPADLERTARLLTRDLAATTARRFALGLLGGVAGPLVLAVADLAAGPGTVVAAVSLVAVVAGELLERSLFFRAVTAPRMPGGLA